VLRTAGVNGKLSCDIILPTLNLLSLTRNGVTVSCRCTPYPCVFQAMYCSCNEHVAQHSTTRHMCIAPNAYSQEFWTQPNLQSCTDIVYICPGLSSPPCRVPSQPASPSQRL
jgi:hypothetical protein